MNTKILTAILVATFCFCLNGKSQLLDFPLYGGSDGLDLNSGTPPALNFTDDVLFDNLPPPQIFVPNIGGWFLPQANGGFIAHPFTTGLESRQLNSITLNMGLFSSTQFDSTTGVLTPGYTPIQGDLFIKVFSGSLLGVGNCIDTLTSYQGIGSSFVMFQSSTLVSLESGTVYWMMVGSTAPALSYVYNFTTSAEHTGSGDTGSLYAISGDGGDSFSSVHSDLTSVFVEMRIGVVPIPEPANYAVLVAFGSLCFLLYRKRNIKRPVVGT